MRPLILITNDDGILAPGLALLAEAVADLGDVVVCAPETERSGSSHSITLHSHLRVRSFRPHWWSVTGTPVDCVYLAALDLCPRCPDLVIAGINPGFNLGSDVFYSGTVGGAAEGYRRGASAFAISMSAKEPPCIAMPIAHKIAQKLLQHSQRSLLNINIPEVFNDINMSRETNDAYLQELADKLPFCITRLGQRHYQNRVEKRNDLQGKPYYWIGGPPLEAKLEPGEDTWAISHHMVSLTPLELDITASSSQMAQRMFAEHLNVAHSKKESTS